MKKQATAAVCALAAAVCFSGTVCAFLFMDQDDSEFEAVPIQTESAAFDKEAAYENYDSFKERVNYGLYRQGNPEQVYIAENPELPFSEIETFTSEITLDGSLADVTDVSELKIDSLPFDGGETVYSEWEIAVNDGVTDRITFYFADKCGAPYPDAGSAIVSHCENISLAIFKINDGLLCTAVGRDVPCEELLETVQSLKA